MLTTLRTFLRPGPADAASAADPPPAAATLAGYFVLYCLLDWISYISPLGGTDITPWNPQWALAVAMLARSPHMARVTAATLLAAMLQPALRHAAPAELVANALEVFGDVAMAVALRRWLGPLPPLRTRRDFVVFVVIVAGGAAIQSVLYATVLVVTRHATLAAIPGALVSGWVGAVNLVVALPLIFALSIASRRDELVAMARTVEWWVVAGTCLAVAYTVFVRSMGEEFKHFYLLFVPVAWAAARFGFAGAVAAATLVQLLLALAAQSLPYETRTVFEMHMLLVVLGATGLLIGTTVGEREQAERTLRASLHAAAAADMAAALAHELNQPLTSLVTYARAAQLMVSQLAAHDAAATEPLTQVSAKIAGEAMRAGETVRRLRDFFRRRGTQREPTDLRQLIDDVVRTHAATADVSGVGLEVHAPPTLPEVVVDRVQIEVVLRNLVANALEAAAQEAGGPPVVRVEARADERDTAIVVAVRDSGPGIDAGRIAGLFDDRRSSKPGGMGIGLAISRSIIEVHDGRLWAEPGPGGKFFFSLPCPESHDASE